MNQEAVSLRILIVDDDPDTAELQKRQLTRSGYAVIATTSLAEALEELHRGNIALMVIDYLLADDMNGLEFFQHAQEKRIAPPTLLVTGFSKDDILARALRAGIRDVVVKSTEYLDQLLHAVKRVLEKVEA